MSLKIEKWYPYGVSLAAPIAYWGLNLQFPATEEILSAGITFGAIFMGFVATNKTLILTLDSRVMRAIRKGQYFDILLSYLSQSLWSSMVFTLYSFSLFFCRPVACWLAMLWLYLAAVMVLTFYRVTRCLLSVVSERKKT